MRNYVLLLFFLILYRAYPGWEACNNGLHGARVSSVAKSGDYLFIATAIKGGLYLTTNNGESWEKRNTGLSNCNIYCLSFKGNLLFAGTFDGVYISSDYGKNWARSSEGLTNPKVFCIAFNDDDIYVGTWGSGIFRSTDNGLNWMEANNGIEEKTVNSIAAKNGNLFAVSEDDTMRRFIYCSSDNGEYWAPFMNGLPADAAIGDLFIYDTLLFTPLMDKRFYFSSIYDNNWEKTAVNTDVCGGVASKGYCSVGSKLFACGLDGVLISEDNGRHWLSVLNGLINHEIDMLFSYDTVVYAAAYGSGLYYSVDCGKNWIQMENNGLDEAIVFSLASDNRNLYAGTNDGIYKSPDWGNSWTKACSGLSNNRIVSLTTLDDCVFAGTGHGLFRSDNEGASWSLVETGINSIFGFNYVTSHNSRIYASFPVNNKGIIFSDDKGKSWQTQEQQSILNGKSVGCLAFSDNETYAAVDGTGLLSSSDGGYSWRNPVSSESPIYSGFIVSVGNAIITDNSSCKPIISYNGGADWSLLCPQGSVFDKKSIRSMYEYKGYLFAYTLTDELYYSSDLGQSWVKFDEGIDDDLVSCLKVVPPYIYASTTTNGIYRMRLQELGIDKVDDSDQDKPLIEITSSKSDDQADVAFSLPVPSVVRLEIYDYMGRLVETVFDGFKEAGSYRMPLPTGDYTSGLYLLCFRYGNNTVSEKFAISR